jgi:hypothetical protein
MSFWWHVPLSEPATQLLELGLLPIGGIELLCEVLGAAPVALPQVLLEERSLKRTEDVLEALSHVEPARDKGIYLLALDMLNELRAAVAPRESS